MEDNVQEVYPEPMEASEPVQSIIMETLRFTPRSVKELEDRLKKPVQMAISQTDMNTLSTFVEKGLQVNNEQAMDAIEEYLNMGADTMELQVLIIEVMERDGFLPKALNLAEKIRSQFKKMESLNLDTLEILG